MSFISEVQKLRTLDNFTGGNDKQRAHLNDIIDRINEMIKAANNDPQGGNIVANSVISNDTIWLAVDGVATEFGIYLEPITP